MLALVLSTVAALQPGPVVHSQKGAVQGFILNGTAAFRGIPYATPPLGKNRFRPPIPPVPWTGTLNTSNFGPSCLQYGSPAVNGKKWHHAGWPSINVNSSAEDCLYLNVYTPVGSSADSTGAGASASAAAVLPANPLPVMVYLHAGEFRSGSGNDQENNWPYFADGKVLLVTCNVRLGILGDAGAARRLSEDSDSVRISTKRCNVVLD
eukprot:gene16174-24754_t